MKESESNKMKINYIEAWDLLKLYYEWKLEEIPLSKFYYENYPKRIWINNTRWEFVVKVFESKEGILEWLGK